MDSDDRERVFEIELECFPSAWPGAVLWRVIATPHMRTFVVEEDGAVQGFVIVGTKSGVVHVWNLAVAHARRRRGLGTALLHWVLDLARREGYGEVGLSVREGNLGAQLAYRRAGFRAVEIKHLGYGDEDAYEMRLELGSDGARR
jgi:ribosomal-protein-alanine N-acetyltransferase